MDYELREKLEQIRIEVGYRQSLLGTDKNAVDRIMQLIQEHTAQAVEEARIEELKNILSMWQVKKVAIHRIVQIRLAGFQSKTGNNET